MILVLLLLTTFSLHPATRKMDPILDQLSLTTMLPFFLVPCVFYVSPVGAKHSSGSEAPTGGVDHGPQERLVLDAKVGYRTRVNS